MFILPVIKKAFSIFPFWAKLQIILACFAPNLNVLTHRFLIFNIGTGNFLRSTLLKYLQAKQYDKASAEFLKWRKANGKVLKGLEARRKDEQELFNK